MNKCVLITGGGGFLGTNLVEKMVLENYAKQIIIVDNFITGNKSNIHKLQIRNDFRKLFRMISLPKVSSFSNSSFICEM